jgi:hypothetical protein
MASPRRIAALRALAERPGTPAEGEAARRTLDEALAREPERSDGFGFNATDFVAATAAASHAFEEFHAVLVRAFEQRRREAEAAIFASRARTGTSGTFSFGSSFSGSPTGSSYSGVWMDDDARWHAETPKLQCACGVDRDMGKPACANRDGHARIQRALRLQFPIGARVYYNRYFFPPDTPAIVIGHPSQFNFLNLRFEGGVETEILASSRQGFHVSIAPLGDSLRAEQLRSKPNTVHLAPTERSHECERCTQECVRHSLLRNRPTK